MLRWLTRLLYESAPAEFRSAYDVDESVERLLAATKRSAFSALGETAAVGKVAPQNVRLQRVIPMVQNSFKPFYTGRFETRDGVTVLTGHFGMSKFTKIFMTFWLVLVASVSAGFLLDALKSTTSAPAGTVIGPLFLPLFMLAAGLGLIALGKWFARNDVAWLSAIIAQALGDPGAGAVAQVSNVDATAVPGVLKGVALFLAASSALSIFMDFFGPRIQLEGPASVARQLGHWQLGFAVSGLALAAGVWRRRPWAWWGGFVLLGLSMITSWLAMSQDQQLAIPVMMRVIFGIFAVLVAGIWGRWWYAQRRHFLWESAR